MEVLFNLEAYRWSKPRPVGFLYEVGDRSVEDVKVGEQQ
jgi:hypothetical protein